MLTESDITAIKNKTLDELCESEVESLVAFREDVISILIEEYARWKGAEGTESLNLISMGAMGAIANIIARIESGDPTVSHVATIDVTITDLVALEAACKRCGLEFVRDQKTYNWYGRHVGDYPLPDGFSADDLGKCSHAIRVPGNANAYEIGLVKRRDGKPGYTLLFDFYQGGYGLMELAGDECANLRQQYSIVTAIKTARKQGHRVTEQKLENGKVKLVLR